MLYKPIDVRHLRSQDHEDAKEEVSKQVKHTMTSTDSSDTVVFSAAATAQLLVNLVK